MYSLSEAFSPLHGSTWNGFQIGEQTNLRNVMFMSNENIETDVQERNENETPQLEKVTSTYVTKTVTTESPESKQEQEKLQAQVQHYKSVLAQTVSVFFIDSFI